jgi:MarR family transcriptional regulator, organic hydroperoxide resistance regulator
MVNMTIPHKRSSNSDTALETLKLFRIIFKCANRHFHAVEKTMDIGGASLWALAEIAETKDLTVTGLAKAMVVHQSTASNLMDRLVNDGYVVRSRCEDDRRVVRLSLTKQGEKTLSQVPQPHRGVLPDALLRLNPATLQSLNHQLAELIAGIQGKAYDSAFEPLGKA